MTVICIEGPMPEECKACEFSGIFNDEVMYCKGHGKKEIQCEGIPKWCPRREVPEPIQEETQYAKGFNEAIRFIAKERS